MKQSLRKSGMQLTTPWTSLSFSSCWDLAAADIACYSRHQWTTGPPHRKGCSSLPCPPTCSASRSTQQDTWRPPLQARRLLGESPGARNGSVIPPSPEGSRMSSSWLERPLCWRSLMEEALGSSSDCGLDFTTTRLGCWLKLFCPQLLPEPSSFPINCHRKKNFIIRKSPSCIITFTWRNSLVIISVLYTYMRKLI